MKKPMPKISVIIPTLNEESYIEATLLSIKNQDCGVNYEVIVCDGQSTDKTVRKAEKLADKVIICKKRGIGYGRNEGAKYAKGDLLVFIDADTILPPNYLCETWEIYKQNKYVGFSTVFKLPRISLKYKLIEMIFNSMDIMRGWFGKTILPGYNTCVPKSDFKKVGGFPEIFNEDVWFSEKLRKIGKIRLFTHFYVIASSRREMMGFINLTKYYYDIRRVQFKGGSSHNYVPVR